MSSPPEASPRGVQVDLGCWSSSPEVMRFVKSHANLSSVRDLSRFYGSRVIASANAKGRTAVVWQEAFDLPGVRPSPDSVVVHVWMDRWQQELSQVTKVGYRALLSSCAPSLLCIPSWSLPLRA